MTSFTDVFGSQTLPPSDYGYVKLTITADTTVVWPYNADSTSTAVAKITEVDCQATNALTLPDATQVSVGEDILIRNVGSNVLIVKNSGGTQIASVAVGAASYFYLTDNTSVSGIFSVVDFGVGTSSVDAASLVGYGIKAVGASLNQSHPVLPVASGFTIDNTHRASLIVFTGGAATFDLTAAATLGDDFFVLIRNDGTGTLTLDPATSETIDGLMSVQLQPSESMFLLCTGTQWYSVGYGRSTLYQFTQLTLDVSAGGTITLTAAEAANKLITFIGNPSGAVTVVVPAIVAVYYTYSAISTAHSITVKTASGSGATVDQGSRVIMLCDATNVLSAQSAVSNSSVSLTDGSVTVPALFFATQTNTGIYKYGTDGLGFAINGVDVGHFTSTGLTLATPLAVTSGGTGATTAGAARTNLGIPVSTQNAEYVTLGTIAGANTITAVATPVVTAYATGQTFRFVSVGNNSGAVTLNIDGLGAKAVMKSSTGGPVVLAAGDIQAAGIVLQVTYDGTQFQLSSGVGSSSGGGAVGGGTDSAMYENDVLITQDYTLGQNTQIVCTITIDTPANITVANDFIAGQPVFFSTTGALPTGLVVNEQYFVIATGLTASNIRVSTTLGGAAVNTTGTQSGVHKVGKIKNAGSFGIVTIADGKVVTIPTGATWSIV